MLSPAALDLFVDRILNRHNVSRLQPAPLRKVSSGSYSLDLALGGGLPVGSLVEIYGAPGVGKTTLALCACIDGQTVTDKQCVYLETEHKPIRDRAARLGADFSKLLLLQHQNVREVVDCLYDLVRSGRFWLVVLDSLASLTNPDAEPSSQDAVVDSTIAAAMPKLSKAAAETNTCILILNQVRSDETSFFHQGCLISPAPLSVAHHVSLRLDLTKLENIFADGPVTCPSGHLIGHRIRAVTRKTCVGRPYLAPTLVLDNDLGFDHNLDILNLGCELGIVSFRSGSETRRNIYSSRFSFSGFKEGRQQFAADPELKKNLLEQIEAAHRESNIFAGSYRYARNVTNLHSANPRSEDLQCTT
jgi:recombination protein RecA